MHEIRLTKKLVQRKRLSRTTESKSECCQGLKQGASGKAEMSRGQGDTEDGQVLTKETSTHGCQKSWKFLKETFWLQAWL